jgi:hypothetical protein
MTLERPSHALRSLRRGDIGLRAYLRARVTHAMAPLRAELSAEQFRIVAGLVRQRLLGDPVLFHYIRQLVGVPAQLHAETPPPSRPGGVG